MFKIDTHVHTDDVSPCAHVKSTEAVALYKKQGYSGIVITDHYSLRTFIKMRGLSQKEKIEKYLSGYRSAKEEGERLGLKVYLGMEITFSWSMNDYLVFGMEEDFLLRNFKLCGMGLSKFRRLADENNLLIYQAHPFRVGMTRTDPKYLDGVEVFNGNPRHKSNNESALEFARKNGLHMSSGSDFHRPEDLAAGGMKFPELPDSNAGLVKMLKEAAIENLITNW